VASPAPGSPLSAACYWRMLAPGGVASICACVGAVAVLLKKMAPLWFVANDRLPVEVNVMG
jgi:hypothetical protein